VTATCPNGHVSTTADYCDHCGSPIASVTAPEDRVETGETPDLDHASDGTPVGSVEPCPVCGTERIADDRYCESCGFDFATRAGGEVSDEHQPATSTWRVTVTADRAYYDRLAPQGLAFPEGVAARTFLLEAARVRIGRRGTSDDTPEIDLAGAPEDTAISHFHAELHRQPDQTYVLLDLDSTNGTTVNDDDALVPPGVPIALAEGAQVHVGAWTTITLHAPRGDAPPAEH
jgi:hypothetical protein